MFLWACTNLSKPCPLYYGEVIVWAEISPRKFRTRVNYFFCLSYVINLSNFNLF